MTPIDAKQIMVTGGTVFLGQLCEGLRGADHPSTG
jgi:hypothetical protein